MKLLSLEKLIQEAIQTVQKYPFEILSGLVAALVGIIALETEQQDNIALFNLGRCAVWGISLFFCITMLSRRFELSVSSRYLAYLGGLLFLILYFYLLPQDSRVFGLISGLRYFLWVLSTHLLASFALFVFEKKQHLNAFWQYNQALFLRFLMSFLYSSFLYMGISIALGSIQLLFAADISWKLYFSIWFLLAGVFNTWLFLAGVPDDVDELENTQLYPRGLKIFTQYVLLPLVTLYLCILYLYGFKILLEWSLPKGFVTYLILNFSIAGIFSLLLIYPIREEEGNRWIKIYSQGYYLALLPLTVLLFVAIGRRVYDYGITEARYFVLLLAFWLLGIALYFVISKTKNIKVIPISLFLIFFLSSFGPWGAFGLSEQSQKNRLINVLNENGMIKDGKFVPSKKSLAPEVSDEIKSLVNFFADRYNLATLQPYLNFSIDSLYQKDMKTFMLQSLPESLVLQQVGITNNSENLASEALTVNFMTKENSNLVTISGYDYALEYNFYGGQTTGTTYENGDATFIVHFVASTNELLIKNKEEKVVAKIRMNTLIEELQKEENRKTAMALPNGKMQIIEENNQYKIKLQLRRVDIRFDKKSAINSFDGYLHIKKIK
ncbi:MAG: DUF4153 domain-containing protein [Cytophagales bacterium]|nr:MAG: DUF4153 domain-containing protein [Cytophagales bacterium]